MMTHEPKGQYTFWGTIHTQPQEKVLPTYNNQVTANWTLNDARKWLEQKLIEGADCPCCGQRAQIYRRVLNAGMARALVLMWKKQWTSAEGYVDIRQIDVRGGDYAKLTYWSMIKPYVDAEGETKPGLWVVTEVGAEFVLCRASASAAVYVYNGKALPIQDKQRIGIHEALGKKFSFEELMRPHWPQTEKP